MWRRCTLVLLLAAIFSLAAQPPNEFHFSIVGDRTGGAVPGVYQRVWLEISLLRPDFVINVGDTIQGTSDDRVEAQWKEIRRFLSPYQRFPFYYVPGNHDIWDAFSRKVYERETGRPAFYSFNYQNAHFTVLDNSGSLDLPTDQLQFLETDLKRNRERRPKFVFFHQPCWLFYLKLGSGRFPLHRLARDYGVDYVIGGHIHQFLRLERDGIVYLSVGSSGARIKPSFPQGLFFQHIWVQVKGASARFTVKELGPPFGEGRSFDAADWGENGPKRLATGPPP